MLIIDKFISLCVVKRMRGMWGWLHLQHIGASLNGGRGLDRLVKLVYDALVTPTPRPEIRATANATIIRFDGVAMRRLRTSHIIWKPEHYPSRGPSVLPMWWCYA